MTWVQGEFYWRVKQGERAQVTDFEGQGQGKSQGHDDNSNDNDSDNEKRLSREQAGNEVTWSAGQTISAAAVADAFGIAPGARAALQRDTAPLAGKGFGLSKVLVIVAVVIVLVLILAQCGNDDCDNVRSTFGAASTEYQQCKRTAGSGYRGRGGSSGGGSYGGYSSGGGGHK